MRNKKSGVRYSLVFIIVSLIILVIGGCNTTPISETYRIKSNSETNYRQDLHSFSEHRTEGPELGRSSSLKNVLAFGAANNAGLAAAFHRYRSAVEAVSAAGGLPDPQFSYAYFLEEVETRVGPQQHKLSLSQMFPSGRKLHYKEEMALREAEIKYKEFQLLKSQLYKKIRKTYFKGYYFTRAIALTKENLARLKLLEPIIRNSYKVGRSPHSDLIRIQIAIEKEKEKLETFKDSLANTSAALNGILNRPPISELPEFGPVKVKMGGVKQETKSDIYRLLQRYNRELALLKSRIHKSETALELSRVRDGIDIKLGVDWVLTGERDVNVDDNGKDPVMVMVGINLPVFREKYRSMEKSAHESVRSAVRIKQERESIIFADLEENLNDIKTAERKINLYEQSIIPRAKQSYNVSRAGFETEESDFLDLINSSRLIIELQLSVEKMILERAEKYVELSFIFGEHVTFFDGE